MPKRKKKDDLIITPDMMVDIETLSPFEASRAAKMAIKRGEFIRRNFARSHAGHNITEALKRYPDFGEYRLAVDCQNCGDRWRVETNSHATDNGIWVSKMTVTHEHSFKKFGATVKYFIEYGHYDNPNVTHYRHVHIFQSLDWYPSDMPKGDQ